MASAPGSRRAAPTKKNAEEIAAYAVYVCGDDAAFITGQALVIDGGLTL